MKVPITTYSPRHARRVQVMQGNEQIKQAKENISKLLKIALLLALYLALILVLKSQGWN